MLTSLRFKNFKAFQDSGELRIAPLTVLTGANSSGKSTILKALLGLKQMIDYRDPEVSFSLSTYGFHAVEPGLDESPLRIIPIIASSGRPQCRLLHHGSE